MTWMMLARMFTTIHSLKCWEIGLLEITLRLVYDQASSPTRATWILILLFMIMWWFYSTCMITMGGVEESTLHYCLCIDEYATLRVRQRFSEGRNFIQVSALVHDLIFTWAWNFGIIQKPICPASKNHPRPQMLRSAVDLAYYTLCVSQFVIFDKHCD